MKSSIALTCYVYYICFLWIGSVQLSISLALCLQSLSGHTTPVDAVKFSSSEDVVIAGSLSGALKLWDLESVKSRHLLAVLSVEHL